MKVSIKELKQAIDYINKVSKDIDIRIDLSHPEILELTCGDLSSNLVIIRLYCTEQSKSRPKVIKTEELK